MRVHKASLALATIIAALAGASATDSASAGLYSGGYWGSFSGFSSHQLYRAPHPDASLPGVRSPSSGIPQALPGRDRKMNRGGMGAPPMRGAIGGRR